MIRRPSGLRVLLAAAAVSACGSLLGDPDRIIGLEVPGGTSRSVKVGDTLLLTARGITARGDRTTAVSVQWAVIDTAVSAFSLDPASGKVVGLEPGSGRVQGSYRELKTDPITITVLPSPSF